ncbi:hypothetical protein [Aliiruegeria sabulilitoris]|uniref:hypothetical protein n=1 Tax=Aliiruegeria sabulilitoris TaxID=1510458 RepID=UPI000833195C|nr:hypothetical protein [Aliiruegeria sabulilitoris]NDR57247.1 hypothetical protein [Pseudoruegeria sp. M32A2M]
MLRFLRAFLANERGAISVDWIVLAAGMVTFALGATSLVVAGTSASSEHLATTIAERPVGD